jgi:hypothetical protein
VVQETSGGVSFQFWKQVFRRNSFENCVIHAKAYAKRCNKYRNEISVKKTRNCNITNDLKSKRETEASFMATSKEKQEEIKKLILEDGEYVAIIAKANEVLIKPDFFSHLANSGAYKGSSDDNSNRLSEVYLDCIRKKLW